MATNMTPSYPETPVKIRPFDLRPETYVSLVYLETHQDATVMPELRHDVGKKAALATHLTKHKIL